MNRNISPMPRPAPPFSENRGLQPTYIFSNVDYIPKSSEFLNGATQDRNGIQRRNVARTNPVVALTSISPDLRNYERTTDCLHSWRRAGLRIVAFQHLSELDSLTKAYPGVEFVPVEETSVETFGRHYIKINTMLDWAADFDLTALIINSDIELKMTPLQMQRCRWIAEGGLCFFIRHNYDTHYQHAIREPDGIDAFLVHGRDASLFPDSFLSMGQPYWDYWLPHTYAVNNRPIWSVEFPIAFHRRHPLRWSDNDWLRCMLEFLRLEQRPGGTASLEARWVESSKVRRRFDEVKRLIPQEPVSARDRIVDCLSATDRPLIYEIASSRDSSLAEIASAIDARVVSWLTDEPLVPRVLPHRDADLTWISLPNSLSSDSLQDIRQIARKSHYIFVTDREDRDETAETIGAEWEERMREFRVVECWEKQVLLENRFW